MPASPASTEAIGDPAELRRHFDAGSKPRAARRIGVEHEKIAVLGDGSAPDHEHVIGPLLERLAGGGWERVQEDGRTIALHRAAASVTLEPGGQIELSDAPRASARAAADALRTHLDELAPIADAAGLRFLGVGFRPLGTLDEVPWMPKGRYRVMREYLPTRGAMALEMMKRTATVQANLDFEGEADCADKLRTAMGVSSLVTALWAASPLENGRPNGHQSYRASAWLATDDDRCGLLRFVFDDDAPARLFERYAGWALDVPMFFVYRDGIYHPAKGQPFRAFLRDGFRGHRATHADWELHLSTLFPEVRLKHYLEVRGADAGPLEMVCALPALYRGVLYDPEARRAAWSLVEKWTWAERVQLRREVPRAGLRATVAGQPILARCAALVEIARAGLSRLGDDDPTLLDPVTEIAATGRSIADRILEAHHAANGDRARLIEALRLR